MRIGLDAYVTAPNQGGFTSYISRIVRHLSTLGEDELLVYVPSRSRVVLDALARLPRVVMRSIEFDPAAYATRTERDTTWHQTALLHALETDQPDVCFGTCQFLPLSWNGPSVVTMHDVIFERHPEFFTPGSLDLYRTWSKRAAKKANAIITVSQSSAEDVQDVWGIDDKPIVATPLGSALAFVPADREESRRIVAAQLGVDGDFALSVAAGHPRKNLAGTLRAYAGLPEALRKATRLVLVNLDHPRVHALVRAHSLEEFTIVTDRLPDEIVPHVYAAATVLVHPSYYEGFGLPVLEAMACGTPVVSSTRPAIPEIAGDAAILVDPDDKVGLTTAVERVLTDADLRAKLSTSGRERSTAFDWAKTAATTRAVLASVAET